MIASTVQEVSPPSNARRLVAASPPIALFGMVLCNLFVEWHVVGKFRQIYQDMRPRDLPMPFLSHLVVDYPAVFSLLPITLACAAVYCLRISNHRRLGFFWFGLIACAVLILAIQVIALFMPLVGGLIQGTQPGVSN